VANAYSSCLPVPVAEVRAEHLGIEGTVFAAGEHVYRTTGRIVGKGGTGTAFLGRRYRAGDLSGADQEVVLKVLSDDVLWRVQNMPVLGAHFAHNCQVLPLVDRVGHPNLLPHYLAQPIADNYLVARPMADWCLNTLVIGRRELGASDRLGFFIDALEGLAALHRNGIVHGDFTLRNVAVNTAPASAQKPYSIALFDFDQSVAPCLLPPDKRSYRAYYDGYLMGCPQFSTTPEVVDDALGDEPMGPRADVYAAGTALYHLITEKTLYGECDDMEEIQRRIQRGLVRGARCELQFPDDFPRRLRPLVERCLQRHPRDRFADAGELLAEMRRAVEFTVPTGVVKVASTHRFFEAPPRDPRMQVFEARPDRALSVAQFERAVTALAGYGYRIERCLHRVRDHGVFVVQPDPSLLAADQFADRNEFRKVVTAIDLSQKPDGAAWAHDWIQNIRPVVERVRLKYLTPLYRAVHDVGTQQLLLFTEYLSEVRFGEDLLSREVPVCVALALGVELAEPLRLLHETGLAHNNVSAGSLMFKADRDAGTVQPLLAGLVEPVAAPAAREDDVRRFAKLLVQLLGKSGQGGCSEIAARVLTGVADYLVQVARHEMATPPIEIIAGRTGDALAAVDPTFAVIRAHRGDVPTCAALLSHARLYHLLFR
jgi:serine/threonine protein kinase